MDDWYVFALAPLLWWATVVSVMMETVCERKTLC